MKTYKVTLHIELDPDEVVEGVRLREPDRWGWTDLLRTGGYNSLIAFLEEWREVSTEEES
jgi:hypothetical protein